MDIQEIIWTIAVPGVMLGVVMGARWLAAKYEANNLLTRGFAFVELMGERGRDKYLMEVAAAKDPASPGGTTITAAEMSALRASVWKTALAEAPKALRDVLNDEIGAEQGKAIIGAKIREAGVATAPAPVGA